MPNVVEEIPEALRPEVDAALAWVNREKGAAFRVTGIVDPEQALARKPQGSALELGLVLCQGDLCLREQVRVRRGPDGIECGPVEAPATDDPPAELDPPAGARAGWLADQLSQQAFVVLIFYRGFW